MPCSICARPLFAVEQPSGLCREHGLRHKSSLYDLGSILPPLPLTNSVRVVHRVLTPTEDELRAFVGERQSLTPAMREPLRLVTP